MFVLFQVYKTPNGVTCIGYTDMASRLANTASTLFSNNAVKLFASAGPFSTGWVAGWLAACLARVRFLAFFRVFRTFRVLVSWSLISGRFYGIVFIFFCFFRLCACVRLCFRLTFVPVQMVLVLGGGV